MRIKEINSAQNPWFKETKKLIENNRFRKKQGHFVVEGFKEISLAISAGFELKQIAFDAGLTQYDEILERLEISDSVAFLSLTRSLMSELVVRSDIANALGVFENKSDNKNIRTATKNPSILIIEGVEKPGNLGAILRTADAAQIDEIWLCDANVDEFHPQVIRNSLGTVFHVSIFQYTFEACVQALQERNIKVYSTFMNEAKSIYEVDFNQGFAVVLGTEHEGVSERWRTWCENIQIPMLGHIDSLNVSVAAAVIMYENVRQRRVKS